MTEKRAYAVRKRPRGKCAMCSTERPLNVDGRPMSHDRQTASGRRHCIGSESPAAPLAPAEPQCMAVTRNGHRCSKDPHEEGTDDHEAEGAADNGGTLVWTEHYLVAEGQS